MKYLLAVFGFFSLSTAHAGKVFTSYEDYYQQQHGIFLGKVLKESNEGYSIQSAHGLCGEDDMCKDHNGNLGSKKIKITVSQTKGAFQIKDRSFYYRDARVLDGAQNPPEESPLYGVSAYIARKNKNRPDIICIEGYYMGSGRFRNTEVFLVINPLGSRNKTQFLHLPGLHLSCMAVLQEPDGSISYPSNSYVLDDKTGQSTGLSMKYFSVKNGVPRSLSRETRLRFIEAGNPFKFSIE